MVTRKAVKIGRFRVERRLGQGMQGTVYRATDEDLQRPVALKVLHHAKNSGVPPQAQNLARLRHPNIVSLYEVGVYNTLLYLVFELINGHTLEALLRDQKQLPPTDAARIMAQVIAAVAHAHRHGIAHLDLSPGNIMLEDGPIAKVMDFDLSGQLDLQSSCLTSTLTGTPIYMAPEHFTSRLLDFRTDVYALGAIFYELMAGVPAVEGDDNRRVIHNIIFESIDFAPLRATPQTAMCIALLQKATHRQPERRFADAGEMLEALKALQSRLIDPDSSTETLAFLLRRMHRRQDFPALSKTLMEINQLTGDNSRASAEQLANVILRDFAVTNKILKLANSSFYAREGGQIKNVSDAIKLLGTQQIRLIANNLLCFSARQDKNMTPALRDLQTHAFLTALLSRHLAQRVGLKSGEQAFICGMFHNLGRTLVAYYLPEEFVDIQEALESSATDERTIAQTILGVAYDELAISVATMWEFPAELVATLRDIATVKLPAPQNDLQLMHAAIAFAARLADLPLRYDLNSKAAAVDEILSLFQSAIDLTAEDVNQLLQATVQKLEEFAPLLDLNLNSSPLYAQLTAFIEPAGPDAEPKRRSSQTSG